MMHRRWRYDVMLRIMMLLVKTRNDAMFAHYAFWRNIIYEVNIIAKGNITCPQGQTSFKKLYLSKDK